MATKVILPKLGQTMEEGTIVEWFKKEGDPVERGEALFSVESDKAVLEVEAKAKGVLRKILVPAGTKVPIMTPVAIIGAPDEDIAEMLAEEAPHPSPLPVAGEREVAPHPGPLPGVPRAEHGVKEIAPHPGPLPVAGEREVAPHPGPRPGVPGAEYWEREAAPHPGPRPERGERGMAPHPSPLPVAGERGETGRIVASPRARRVASEKWVDLAYVAGSGPGGRIIEKDVLAYAAAQPKATPLAQRLAAEAGIPLASLAIEGTRITAEQVRAAAAYAPSPQPSPRLRGEGVAPSPQPSPLAEGAEVVTPLAGVRAVIAERMATSAHTTAAVTLQSVVDATELVTLRTRLKEAFERELGFAIGYNDLLAYIVARCLTEYPYMNARLEPEGIRQLSEVNLGLAVDSERGLLVPVIRGANHLGVRDLAVRFRELVTLAREGKAGPDDLTGGTFTITNLGMFGVDAFTPIINLPECAILGVGRIRPEPVAQDGQVVVRQRMWLSLTFDHRLVDGAPAARFLQAIMRYIESPYLLLA